MAKTNLNFGDTVIDAEPTDGVLLQRFTAKRDEAAFAALVERHGPLVLGVCRRALQHEQDAEDAFQAVFCVLARKASSIQRGDVVGSWLYAVATRIARKAKASQMRRRMRERELPDVPAPNTRTEWVWCELGNVVDEEVNRLPKRYRQPFVLCQLQGKTNLEAAAELRCALGTISSRLTRARQRLRARLTRRGIALSGGVLAAALETQAPAAAVPAGLKQIAVQTSLGYSAGRLALTGAAELADSFAKSQMLTRWLKVAGWLATAGLIVVVILLVTLGRKARLDAPPMPQASVSKPDAELMQGTWKAAHVKMGGQQVQPKNVQMVFAGDRITLRFPGMPPLSGFFHVEPNKEPKEIDLVLAGGVTWPGIYRLDEDQLQLCIDSLARERPTSLTDERFFFYEMQRATMR